MNSEALDEVERRYFTQHARIWLSPRHAGLVEFACSQGAVTVTRARLVRAALDRFFALSPELVADYLAWIQAGAPDRDTTEATPPEPVGARHRARSVENLLAHVLE